MNKSQKLNQLIETHRCEVHLRVHGPSLLRAAYTYDWDTETSCRFTLLSEVAQSLQDAFRHVLRKRGLGLCGRYETSGRPYVQDLLSPDPKTATGRRWGSLAPDMVPRWLRVYDNDGRSFDRYTAVFTGRAAPMKVPGRANQWPYLGMSERPCHPQGFGQHGHTDHQPCDVNEHGWAPAVGRKNHLGKRIEFADLPEDCRRLVFDDYIAIWRL